MQRRLKKALALVAGLSVMGGCTTVETSDSALIEAALSYKPEAMESYQLGAGDVLRINVWRNPDLSGEVKIRPDGKLSSPLVGDVMAAGMTPEQLAKEVRDRIAAYVREPQVSIIVMSTDSYAFRSRVRVTGAVKNPLSIAYADGLNVLDLLLSAGGLNDFASGNDAILYRQYEGQTVVIPVKAQDLLSKGDVSSNYEMLPGDILTIPEKVL